ncbi:MAG: DUF1015 family protein [Bacteroidota bacterium]
MAVIKPVKPVIPNLDLIDEPADFFDRVKEEFPAFWSQNKFLSDYPESFVVYQQEKDDRTHTGLIGYIDIREYLDKKIIRHENTLQAKRNQMMELFFQREAHVKPALLAYSRVDEIEALLEKCIDIYPVLYQQEYRKAIHRFWLVNEQAHIDEFKRLFKEKVARTYIADGHHRSEATAIMFRKILKLYGEETGGKPYDVLLSAFFASDQLTIHEFNRVVVTQNNYSDKGFKAELRKHFIIEKQGGQFFPAAKNEIGMFIRKKWFKLTPKPHLLNKKDKLIDRLDVSLLNRVILKKVLGIKDVRHDARVKYVEGPKGLGSLEKKVGKNQSAVAFSLFPIRIEELMAIADADEIMPPKSTWFEPRMHNGFVSTRFEI